MGKQFLMTLALLTFSTASFSVTIDINMDKLSYAKPKNLKGKAGVLNFKKFAVETDNVYVAMDNTDKALNSNLSLDGANLTVKGKDFDFGFELPGAEYLNKIDFINLTNNMFKISDRLSLMGTQISAKYLAHQFKLSNYNIFCYNNKLGTLNDVSIACLNNSSITPSWSKFPVSFTYGDEKTSPITVDAKIQRVRVQAKEVTLELGATKLGMKDKVELSFDDMTLSCAKDILTLKKIDKDAILEKCTGAAKANVKGNIVYQIKMPTEANPNGNVTGIVMAASIETKKDSITVSSDGVSLGKDHNLTVALTNSKIVCNKDEETSLLNTNALISNCLNKKTEITAKKADADVTAVVTMQTASKGELKLNTNLKTLEINDSTLSSTNKKTTISYNDKLSFDISSLNFKCDKSSDASISTLLPECLASTKIEAGTVAGFMKTDSKDRYDISAASGKATIANDDLIVAGKTVNVDLDDAKTKISIALSSGAGVCKTYGKNTGVEDVLRGCMTEGTFYPVAEEQKNGGKAHFLYQNKLNPFRFEVNANYKTLNTTKNFFKATATNVVLKVDENVSVKTNAVQFTCAKNSEAAITRFSSKELIGDCLSQMTMSPTVSLITVSEDRMYVESTLVGSTTTGILGITLPFFQSNNGSSSLSMKGVSVKCAENMKGDLTKINMIAGCTARADIKIDSLYTVKKYNKAYYDRYENIVAKKDSLDPKNLINGTKALFTDINLEIKNGTFSGDLNVRVLGNITFSGKVGVDKNRKVMTLKLEKCSFAKSIVNFALKKAFKGSKSISVADGLIRIAL